MQCIKDQNAGAFLFNVAFHSGIHVAFHSGIHILTHRSADVMLSVLVELVHLHLEETI